MKLHTHHLLLFGLMVLIACSQTIEPKEIKSDLILEKEYHLEDIFHRTTYYINPDLDSTLDVSNAQEIHSEEHKPYKQLFDVYFHADSGEKKKEYGKIVTELLFKYYKIDNYNYWLPTHWKIIGYGNAKDLILTSESNYGMIFFSTGLIEIDLYIKLGVYQRGESSNIPKRYGSSCEGNIMLRFIGSKYEMTSDLTRPEFCVSMPNNLRTIFGSNENIGISFQDSFEQNSN